MSDVLRTGVIYDPKTGLLVGLISTRDVRTICMCHWAPNESMQLPLHFRVGGQFPGKDGCVFMDGWPHVCIVSNSVRKMKNGILLPRVWGHV